MTPFGINFDEVLKLVKKFTIGCAFNIGLQALEGIRFYHQAGFINRNIKPATFCVGMGIDEFRVLLADFRLSRTHIEMKKVRKARPTVKYSGTSRYASIAALTCKDQGRKDDLESWIYMLYELIDREEGLSWRHIPRGPMLIKEKENFKAHVLPNTYNNVPADFKKIVDMVHSYSYDSEPDYKAIREIVESVGKAKNLDMSVCDWFGKITKDTQKTAIEIAKDRSTGNRCSGSDDFEFAAKKMVRKIMNEGDTIKNGSFTWIVKCLLGSGGFGDVYKVYDEKSEKKFYALKTESEDGRKAMLRLKVEMQVLMAINDARKKDATKQFYKHFVDFVDRGKSEDLRCKFIVMSLVGPSLDDVRKKYTVRLDNDRSGYIIAIQSVEAVRDLHSLGYLHRDIKPANFAVGFAADEWIVFMLDFGIGRSYLDPKTKEHRAPRKSVKFLGTLRFASRACMKGIDQGRKDDLECWLYMIFDIFDPESGLPWSKSKVRNDITSMKEKFFESKAEADDDSPTVLKELAVYVNGLRFQSTPDYEYIINRLLKFAGDSKSGTTNMQKGGWVGKLTEKNKKENQPDRFSASESDVPVTDDDSCTGN
uniref:Protein kinase domain-containing protein n=1 Tax=Caenorhabditis japonica TaxID=281687 RepID=A0A8R1DGN5_CAEJA